MRTRRIVMPRSARSGDVVEIKTVIQHPMITGHSAGGANTVPRDIVHTLRVSYDGAEVFRAEIFPGIAANPFIAFTLRATRTGEVTFEWIDDSGMRTVDKRLLTVEVA
jgi:sulfur-oxidizing protein SoxZ